jgi:hypothetical protein
MRPHGPKNSTTLEKKVGDTDFEEERWGFGCSSTQRRQLRRPARMCVFATFFDEKKIGNFIFANTRKISTN